MDETTAFWSGHANSSAMILKMCANRTYPDKVVHACTHLEFDFVYEYMEKFERHCPVEIIYEDVLKIKPAHNFIDYFFKSVCYGKHIGEIHGFPKVINPCWYNRLVKQPVFEKYEKISSEVYTGFTKDERHRILWNQYCLKRYPLIEWGWTALDCRKYLKKRGIEYTVYTEFNLSRLGCWLCPKQKDSELYFIYKNYPDNFNILLTLEKQSPHGFRPANKKSLEELKEEWEHL